MTWRVVKESDADGHPEYHLRDLSTYVDRYIEEGPCILHPAISPFVRHENMLPVADTPEELKLMLGKLYEDMYAAFSKPVLVIIPAKIKEI